MRTVTRHQIRTIVNGEPTSVEVEANDVLLDVLRTALGVKSPKIGCERGDCGSCTVLLDGRTVRSCLVLAVEADAHEITTVEGIEHDGLTAVQEMLIEQSSFQCGFCAPGIVLAAAELIERVPHPIRRRGARGDRGESLPVHRVRVDRRCGARRGRLWHECHHQCDQQRSVVMTGRHYVGSREPRIDGRDKVSGAAHFVDDLEFGPDLLHAAVVESPHAHARIVAIDTAAAAAMPGVDRGRHRCRLPVHVRPVHEGPLRVRAGSGAIRR